MKLQSFLRYSLLLALTIPASFAADALRVMSMNVRYPNPDDGRNVWEQRRDLMVDLIREKQPDLIGTQELFQLQGDYIVGKLPGYAWFGLSRRGNHTDEHMGVFYRKSRLKLIDSGNFWLSETPETPASMSWNITLPRMVTWGEFEDRSNGRKFRLYNTHFPHLDEDEAARTKCAQVIAARIQKLAAGETAILTGDFNTDVKSAAHAALAAVLRDAWEEMKNPSGPRGTFHDFKGKALGDERIDWILYRGDLKARSVETIVTGRDGVYPSDHFQVLAVFDWK